MPYDDNTNVNLEDVNELNEEVLVSINENLELSNSYMYTLNVYMAGFFVIVILYLLIKALIGFFKPFL